MSIPKWILQTVPAFPNLVSLSQDLIDPEPTIEVQQDSLFEEQKEEVSRICGKVSTCNVY